MWRPWFRKSARTLHNHDRSGQRDSTPTCSYIREEKTKEKQQCPLTSHPSQVRDVLIAMLMLMGGERKSAATIEMRRYKREHPGKPTKMEKAAGTL